MARVVESILPQCGRALQYEKVVTKELTKYSSLELELIRQSMISEYEHGKRRLTKEMGKKISSALNIKPIHLK